MVPGGRVFVWPNIQKIQRYVHAYNVVKFCSEYSYALFIIVTDAGRKLTL